MDHRQVEDCGKHQERWSLFIVYARAYFGNGRHPPKESILLSIILLLLGSIYVSWSIVTILPLWGKLMVQKTEEQTTFMVYIKIQPKSRF